MTQRNAMMGLRDYTTADLYNQPLRSGAVLPVTEYLDGPRLDMSAGLPGSIGRAITAPARAYRGEMDLGQQIDEAANMAGWLTLGGYMAPKPVNALGAGGAGAKARKSALQDQIDALAGFDKWKADNPLPPSATAAADVPVDPIPGTVVDDGWSGRPASREAMQDQLDALERILSGFLKDKGTTISAQGRNSMLPGALMSDALRLDDYAELY